MLWVQTSGPIGAQAMGPDQWTNKSTVYESRTGGPIGAQSMQATVGLYVALLTPVKESKVIHYCNCIKKYIEAKIKN